MLIRQFRVLSVQRYAGSTLVLVCTDARKGSTEERFFAPDWDIWEEGAVIQKTVERTRTRTNEPQTIFVDSGGLYRIHYERVG